MSYLCTMKAKNLTNSKIYSFDNVYIDNFERLCYHAFCIVGDEDDAKDIVNDVFAFIYEDWEKYSSRSMNSFLLTLVHNASIDFTRHKLTHRKYEQYVLSHENEAEYFSDYEEKVQRVIAEIDNMPEQMRRVFVGCYVKGMKYQQVADEMGLSINTVKTNISRGLKMLRKKLSEEEFLLLFAISSQLL